MKHTAILLLLLTALFACNRGAENIRCGDIISIENSIDPQAPLPQYFLPGVSVLGLPKEGDLKLGPISIDQLSNPGIRPVSFAVPKGCFALAKIYNLGRSVQPDDPVFCFDENVQLMLTPTTNGSDACGQPICASEPLLDGVSIALSEMAIALRGQSTLQHVGTISKDETEYVASYKVDWHSHAGERVPVYEFQMTSASGNLSVTGIHASKVGSTYQVCRPRDLSKIIGSAA